MDDHDDPVADRPVQGLLPLLERSHDAKAQKGQISCLKCPRFVLPGQQCAIRTGGRHASSANSSRILFRLDLLCGGILRRSRGFFPLPEQSLDAGVASAAPKVLLGDVASPFSKGISEKQIFEVLSHVPATEHRMRGAHEIELFKKISPSVVYIQTTDAIGTGSVISDGLILTNYHVVGGAHLVQACFWR
jgi:hypothetical protein